MTRSILRILLGAALAPLAIAEDAPSAAGAPTNDAATDAESASGKANDSASGAVAADASGGPASAGGALGSTGIAAAGDAPSVEKTDPAAVANAQIAALIAHEKSEPLMPPANPSVADPTPTVSIDVEDHAEARERFAGVLATLHGFESEAVAALRAEIEQIGTLLLLHTFASSQAGVTGTYRPADL